MDRNGLQMDNVSVNIWVVLNDKISWMDRMERDDDPLVKEVTRILAPVRMLRQVHLEVRGVVKRIVGEGGFK